MSSDQLSTRVPEAVSGRVEAYGDDNDLSDYESVRKLVKSGLEAEGYGPAADGGRRRLSLAKSTLQETQRGLFFIAIGWLTATYLTTANMALPAVIAGGVGLVCFGLEPRIDALAGRLGFGGGGRGA
jgi:hypothetical protein